MRHTCGEDVCDMHKFLNPRKFRIRTRLVLVYSALIFISILIVSMLLMMFSRQIITRLSVQYTYGILEQMGENIDNTLMQIDQLTYLIIPNEDVLRVLKNGTESIQELQQLEALLVNVMFTRRDIDSIFLFDRRGNRYGTTYTYSYLPYETLLQAAKKGDGKLVWIAPSSHPDILQAARIIYTQTMENVGMLLINVRKSSISSVISKQLSELNGSVLIVDIEGETIAGIRSREPGYLPDEEALNRIRREIGVRPEGAGHQSLFLDGAERIVTYYPSHFIPDWSYITLIPIQELTKDITELMQIGVAVSLVISGLFVLLTYFVAGGIVNPIKEIAQRMQKMEILSLEPESRYAGEDEIGYLDKSFRLLIRRINTLIQEVYEQNLLRKEQELKTLQAQINPHFLYNTLDTVNWMAISRNVPEIGEIVRALSKMLRYSIANENELVPLSEELNHVRNYCQIQSFRLDGRLQCHFQVDEELLDFEMPKLVLQPIVENSILHGFQGKRGICRIVVGGTIQDHTVWISIEDNGKGIDDRNPDAAPQKPPADREYRNGIGLTNVDRRLKLKYGENYGLTVHSRKDAGTTVIIKLPI